MLDKPLAINSVTNGEARHRAFTLIELAVVVLVVAILLAVLISALSGSRVQSKTALVVGRLQQHTAVFQTYAIDWRDYSPYFMDPLAAKTTVTCRAQGISESGEYFDGCTLWPTAMADGYYSGNRLSKVFGDSISAEPDFLWYQRVFMAAPQYWNERTRLYGRSQWVATKVGDVVYPSSKAWLVSNFHSDRRVQQSYGVDNAGRWIVIGFVDGHSERVAAARLGLEYPTAEGTQWPRQSRTRLYTIDGVRGRDIR